MRLLRNLFVSLTLALAFTGTAHAASCPSPEVVQRIDELLGASSYILKNVDFVETTFRGRKVLKLKSEISPGKPTFLHEKLDPNVRIKIEEDGWTNLDLMKNSQPPVGKDGLQINMHHLEGMEPGIMAELPASLHQQQTKILHGFIETSWRKLHPDRITKYDTWRRAYWREQAKLYE